MGPFSVVSACLVYINVSQFHFRHSNNIAYQLLLQNEFFHVLEVSCLQLKYLGFILIGSENAPRERGLTRCLASLQFIQLVFIGVVYVVLVT